MASFLLFTSSTSPAQQGSALKPHASVMRSVPSRGSMQDELDRMRRRLKAERENSEREQQEMIAAMQQAMEAARSKLTEERNAARKQADFLRRCRVGGGRGAEVVRAGAQTTAGLLRQRGARSPPP